MNRIYFFIILAFITLCTTCQVTLAQSSYSDKYNNGKDLYKMGKYTLAMETFKPLMTPGKGNHFVEYASFYYAVSAYQAKQKSVAHDMFLQIQRNNPQWENNDEVNYWLAAISFDNKDYLKGFEYVNKINKKNTKDDAIALKKYSLQSIEDLNLLQQLLQKNPYDKEIAQILADKIAAQPLVKQNTNLLEFLVSEFSLDKGKYIINQDLQSVKKDVYNVAVFFPFMYNELNPSKSIRGNYVLETYEGIKLAKRKLASENVKVNLYAYDSRKDTISVKNILNMPEMKSMDLVVGPLTQGAIKNTTAFSVQNKINMVNPVSTNSEVIGNNPFSFLFKPSLETQAKKAAEYAVKEFAGRKEVLIIYGTETKDSVLANTYKKEMENHSFIPKMLRVAKQDSKKILTYLTPSSNDTAAVLPNNFSHIFVASDEDLIAANTISAVDIRRDQIPVIGREEWLSYKFVAFDQLERLGVLFIAPNYIDYNSPAAQKFREEYLDETHTFPSQYSYSGYSAMLFFGRMLKKYGNYFQINLQKDGFQEGDIFAGFNYLKANDNQFVPIVKFANSELTIVNK